MTAANIPPGVSDLWDHARYTRARMAGTAITGFIVRVVYVSPRASGDDIGRVESKEQGAIQWLEHASVDALLRGGGRVC